MPQHQMVSMKLDASEKQNTAPTVMAEAPDYPYGLRLDLDKSALSKLGIESLPELGSKMELHAVAEVVGVSQSESSPGGEHKSVALQIVELGVGPSAKMSENQQAEVLYGKAPSPLKTGGYAD